MDVTEKIEKYIDDYRSIWPLSGVIYVVKDGNTVFEKAYGMACHEFDIPNTVDTRFTLASVSKQFTAFAVMQLYDKELIDIDTPVNNYLPESLKIDSRITIHHLLSHTSGLKNFYTFEDDFFQEFDRTNFSKEKYFSRYINQELSFVPGEKFEYNNAGYNMLAWLVEEVSGLAFKEYLEEHIFSPLNMQNTFLDNSQDIIKNKADLYTKDRNTIVRCPYYNEKYSIGAGAVISTCHDLYKWYGCLKNKELLSENTYQHFFKVNMDNYCYGLTKDVHHNRDRYYHGGDHLGSRTYVQYFFDDDLCIIVLMNTDTNNQYRLGNAINDIVFNSEPELPNVLKEIVLDEGLTKEYEGVYLDNKIELRQHEGEWEFVRFDDNLRIAIYPIGNHQFAARWNERFVPYTLKKNDQGVFEFFGFPKVR